MLITYYLLAIFKEICNIVSFNFLKQSSLHINLINSNEQHILLYANVGIELHSPKYNSY